MIGWVTGTDRLTDPRVAEALADAGHPGVDMLMLGDAPLLRPVAVGSSGAVRAVVGFADRPDAVVLEANVDDLDPRLWPDVVAALLAAGALDAWLVPVHMKKGRPAVTVAALAGPDELAAVRRVLLTGTSTIGVRETAVTRTVLDRIEEVVEVGGRQVRVKVATLEGTVVNVMPEFEDVAAAAAALGVPLKQVLAAGHAAALPLWRGDAGRQGGG